MKEESPRKQLISKIADVNNILVTVSRDPSVDQLTAALGLSLALNKLGKRSVAVFSGEIPPAINFLDPAKTFESNADSLRDFIISLSKDKADRLKVRPEGDFVKVYITPYRTKITPDDLKFIDGDFNIELIIAIGVSNRDDLDASIASHGKIFHNAVTATLNIGQAHDVLGMISWQDSKLGCYAELCASLISGLSKDNASLIDEPIATALLTGVVSATDQFRNSITSPAIMSLSADLMAKGANQQLITAELDSSRQNDTDGEIATGKRTADLPQTTDDFSFDRNRDEVESTNESSTTYNLEHANDDDINEKLQQSRDELASQRGEDALHTAQARLLESQGTISTDSTPMTEPTSEESSTGSVTEPVNSEPVAAQLVDLPQADTSPVPQSIEQPIEQPMVQPLEQLTQQPSEQPSLPTLDSNQTMTTVEQQPGVAHYIDDAMSHVSGLAVPADGAIGQTSSGSYLITDPDGPNTLNQPSVNLASDLPFNMPNQVSPLAITTPEANSPATTAMPTFDQMMPPAMPTEQTQFTVPSQPMETMAMPPVPPAPIDPNQAGMMPPAMPEQPPMMEQPMSQPMAQPIAPASELPVATTSVVNDPSQFVIPS